jgi:predicted nucleic acid-binding protein
MSGDFLDSNVLVYLVDASEPEKRATARELVRTALQRGDAQISYQVVQDTLNVTTRKFQRTVSSDDARQLLREVLLPLWRVMPSQALYERALDIHARYQYAFYDSLILAGALAGGCTRLYSEDLPDGQRIEGLTVVNPFAGEARRTRG